MDEAGSPRRSSDSELPTTRYTAGGTPHSRVERCTIHVKVCKVVRGNRQIRAVHSEAGIEWERGQVCVGARARGAKRPADTLGARHRRTLAEDLLAVVVDYRKARAAGVGPVGGSRSRRDGV